jgi:hypothetical protein
MLAAQDFGWVGTNSLAVPEVGAHALRVLKPDLMELTLVTTRSNVVSAWDFVGENFTPRLPKPGEFHVQAGGKNVAVREVGFKRRPIYAPLKRRDLRILNQLYLSLSAPVTGGVTVAHPEWKEKFSGNADPLRFSPAIHVNQVGYQTGFPKVAMVGYYLGSLGEMSVGASEFKIVEAGSGKVVFNGSLRPRKDRGFTDSPTPYQNVWEANFTKFDQPGVYRLQVESLGASMPFQIHEGTLAAFARAYALGLYHQRCGTNNALPFTRHTHEACHTGPVEIPNNSFKRANEILAQVTGDAKKEARHTAPVLKDFGSSLYPFVREGKVDASGGHHDAGDYSKYTINSAHLIHALAFAAEYFPGAGGLDNLGLPESGDGKSDLLQTAKWEADFLAKLQDSDGGFSFLVYPKERRYEDNVTPDKGDAQILWPKNTSATAAATAALAELAASKLFRKQFPEAADLYLRRAQRGWAFLERAIAKHGRDGSYQTLTHYGHQFWHDDELAWAAAALFAATGERAYEMRFMEAFTPEDTRTRRWSWWPMFEGWGNATRTYVFSTRLGEHKAGDPIFRARCERLIMETATNHVRFSRETAYGTSFPDPNKANRNAGWFFSNERAFDLTVGYQLLPSEEIREAVIANLNYEAGCNPVNVSYLTGVGLRRQREIVHQFAQNDQRVLPPTGIPIGNIQAGFAYLHHYQKELGEIAFPPDGAASGAYPFYDRWGDSFNTTTEFVVVDQARSLGSLSFWMAQTPLKEQRWQAAKATITGLPRSLPVGESAAAQLSVQGLNIADAQILWETRDALPVFGPVLQVAPKNVGEQWVEAEAMWPDGRRVFAVASYEATASQNTPPHPTFFRNLDPGPQTLALYHLDGDGKDATGKNPALELAGRASFDASNLSWMRERKGAALRFHDLGDRAQAKIQVKPGSELTLQAMIYVNAFKAYNRTNAKILSLVEEWNSSIELIENLYEGPMIKGGSQFSIGKGPVTAALIPGNWHLLEIRLSSTGYETYVNGKRIGSIAKSELEQWGRKPATLEIGNFDGYVDEIAVITK